MAYGVVHTFANGTQDQYDASIAAVHPSDGSLPEGQVFHAAGPSADGWTIVAIHDSQESWEKFRDGVLMPAMAAGITEASPIRLTRRRSRCTTRPVRKEMEKRLVTRYAMASPEAADENQRRVEGVFAELASTKPDNVSYIVLRLADDSFVHVSFHDHRDDEVNPIASTAAFAHFQEGHAERRAGGVDQQTAELVGAYVTTIA